MKKKISALVSVSLCIFALSSSLLLSQEIEDVSAAVINFLLRNPKTANKMKTGEKIALDIIGDLLKTEGERKHQLRYAGAGRNQITIQTNDGRQAQFVRNEQGNVFLLYDGIIYPVAQELVNQAKGIEQIKIATLSPYNERKLKKIFSRNIYKNGLYLIFTCKWYRDLNGDGFLSVEEYYHKKRTFYIDEDFEIIIYYCSWRPDRISLNIKIIKESTGKLIKSFKNDYVLTKKYNRKLAYRSIPKGTLPTGIYIYIAS